MGEFNCPGLPTGDRRCQLFIGDPQQFPDLTPSLLTVNRVARRARLIKTDRNPGLSGSTRLSKTPLGMVPAPIRRRLPPTASIFVVDRAGDAIALNLTLTKPFGSGFAARGIILNAAKTAFDPTRIEPATSEQTHCVQTRARVWRFPQSWR
jgi:gamma-glutamyltranspeptidase